MKAVPNRLQDLYDKGVRSTKEFVKLTGFHRTTIQRNLKKMQQGMRLQHKKIPGRPQILKARDKRRLIALVKKRDTSSSKELQIEMEKRGSPLVSTRTIRRTLNKAGYYSNVPKFIPFLSEQHKENRLSWCLRHTKTKWGRWVFSDESKFELFRATVGVWSKKRQRIGRSKFTPSLMVWGAISIKGKSDLIFIKGSIDSEKYQETLEKAFPTLQMLHPSGFVFQQDGASCHTSKSTHTWFVSRNWKVSDWPANSPDLNPIENIWGIMKKEIEKKRPKDIIQLEQEIKNSWENIPSSYLVNLIGSMKTRIFKCIELKGDITGY